MLVHLKNLLDKRGIPTQFDPVNDRIHCYAHVIDLGCKAVINNWPDCYEWTTHVTRLESGWSDRGDSGF